MSYSSLSDTLYVKALESFFRELLPVQNLRSEALKQALSELKITPQDSWVQELEYICQAQSPLLSLRKLDLQELSRMLRIRRAFVGYLPPQAGQEAMLLLIQGGKTPVLHRFGAEETTQTALPVKTLRRLLMTLGAEPIWLEVTERKDPNFNTPIQRLVGWIRMEKKELGVVLVYSSMMGLFSLVVPIAIQALVNNVAFGAVLQPVMVLTFLVLIALGFLAFMRIARLTVVEMLQRRVFVKSAADIARRLVQVKIQALEKQHAPELVNRFFDVVTVQKSASFLLLDGLAILLQTLVGMLLLAFYHPFLLGFDLVLLVAISVILFGLGRRAVPTSILESKYKYQVAAWLEEISTHATTFRSQSGMQYALQRTDDLLNRYLDARHGHFKVVWRQNLGAYLLQAVASAALLGIGGWLVIERQLTIGQLVAAELIVASVVDGFAKFGKHLETYYDLLAAVDKIGHLLDLPTEVGGIGLLGDAEPTCAVQFHQVAYTNQGTQKSTLDNVSFRLEAGQKMLIYGSYSRRTEVLVDLIYGLRFPHQGYIEIDRRDTRQLMLPRLREQVQVIRELDIFEGTLQENLRVSRPYLSAEELRATLEQVGLWERVMALPEGVDTVLQRTGLPLSQAEAYRLMIARGLIAQPRLLVLDGVLDLIEWEQDGPLYDTLFSQSPPCSLILITNRDEFKTYFKHYYWFSNQGRLNIASANYEVPYA